MGGQDKEKWCQPLTAAGLSEEWVAQSVGGVSTENISRMEAAFEGAAKAFLETSRIACKWLKETHSLTREQGSRVENNRKSIQESKGNIKNNVREILCIKTSLRDKVTRIERLERQIRSQETALFLQDRKLEDLKEVIRKRGEGI